MSRGAVAAEALLVRHGRPPAPPKLTLVATAEEPACSRCGASGVRLVPAYWAPDRVGLCPSCCVEAVAEYDRDPRLWPRPFVPSPTPGPVEGGGRDAGGEG